MKAKTLYRGNAQPAHEPEYALVTAIIEQAQRDAAGRANAETPIRRSAITWLEWIRTEIKK